MIFVTGADIRFIEIVKTWKKCLDSFAYSNQIYNLDNLGFGKNGFEENDMNFITRGYYNSLNGKWKSTGLWKPKVIQDALNNTDEDIVYLDADAYVMKPLLIDFNFDIGVVKRVTNFEKDPIKLLLRGKYNAGVLFLKNNNEVKEFVSKWVEKIKETKNDQLALNLLLDESSLNIKIFSEKYNTNEKDGFIFHETGCRKSGVKIRFDY